MMEVFVGASLMFVGIITGWTCAMVAMKERSSVEAKPTFNRNWDKYHADLNGNVTEK